jgi:hypothetical protein
MIRGNSERNPKSKIFHTTSIHRFGGPNGFSAPSTRPPELFQNRIPHRLLILSAYPSRCRRRAHTFIVLVVWARLQVYVDPFPSGTSGCGLSVALSIVVACLTTWMKCAQEKRHRIEGHDGIEITAPSLTLGLRTKAVPVRSQTRNNNKDRRRCSR